MPQKTAPSIQHYIKGFQPTPELVCMERLKFLRNPPQMSYKPVYKLFRDILDFKQPLPDLLMSATKSDKRSHVVKNYQSILRLLHEEFVPKNIEAVFDVYIDPYKVSQDVSIPFDQQLVYFSGDKMHLPWLSLWRGGALTGEKLSLFASIVSQSLQQNPDLENVDFQLYDLSSTKANSPRTLKVQDLSSIKLLSYAEQREMLEILERGYRMAEIEYRNMPKDTNKKPASESLDDNQIDLFN